MVGSSDCRVLVCGLQASRTTQLMASPVCHVWFPREQPNSRINLLGRLGLIDVLLIFIDFFFLGGGTGVGGGIQVYGILLVPDEASVLCMCFDCWAVMGLEEGSKCWFLRMSCATCSCC